MGRSFMLSLSVTFVLVGLLYVFMKQKLATSEGKLNTLFGVVQQLAGEIQMLKDRITQSGTSDPSGNPSASIKKEEPEAVNAVIQVSDDDNDSDNSDENSSDEENSDADNSDADNSDEDTSDEENSTEGGSLTMKESEENETMKKGDVGTMEITVEEISTEVPIEDIVPSDPVLDVEEVLPPMEIDLDITPLNTESAGTSKIVEVDLDEDLSKLSVKELKVRVADINGPPLKTKKALIEYLNSKLIT